MTIKEYLRGIRRQDALIKIKLEECQRLESLAIYKGIAQPDPNGGGFGSSDPHSNEKLIIKIVDLQRSLERDIEALATRRAEALKMIQTLKDDNTLRIFYLRYFAFKKWEQIEDELGVSYQWVNELHKRGLIELGKNFKISD